MNKLQIKAEILATLRALSASAVPSPTLLTDLKSIEDKKTVIDVLIRELVNADEQKTLLICWLLTDYNDHIKMVAFNMLKDLGNQIDYEVISGYFEKFNELINKETRELLDTAIMNPEAQIDFMDFLNALSDDDKTILLNL